MKLVRTLSVLGIVALSAIQAIGCGSSDSKDEEEMVDLDELTMGGGKSDWKSDNAPDKGEIGFGEEKSGTFDSRYLSYRFTGNKDASVEIALTGNASQNTDTSLWLYGPKNDSGWGNGQPIAKNDDDGASKFSKISQFDLPEDGEYLIVLAAKNRYFQGKSYTLSLQCKSDVCGSSVSNNDPEPFPRATWTVFLYGSYDSHDSGGLPSSLNDMVKQVKTDSSDVNFLYLEDLQGEDNSKLWRVTKNNKEIFKDYGELHMGDPKTLTDVLSFVRKTFPSRYLFVDLVGHTSGGLAAFMSDYTPAENYPWEKQRFMFWQVREAIQNAGGKVDLLALSGCGTGDLEVVTRMGDVADYVVALQEESFGYSDVRWADALSAGKVEDPEELAYRVADGQFKAGNYQGAIGGYNLSQLQGVKTSFASLVQVLNAKMSTNQSDFARVRRDVFEMITADDFRAFVDAMDFATTLQSDVNDQEIKSKAGDFLKALKAFVPYGGPPNYADSATHERATGLNLLFPRPGVGGRFGSPDGFDECSAWPKDETSYYEETGWRDFVTSVYEAM